MKKRPSRDDYTSEWEIVPTGIKIKTGIVPEFVIRSEYDIEQFFKGIGLNAYNLPDHNGNFDIRNCLIRFIPIESHDQFVSKLKEYMR